MSATVLEHEGNGMASSRYHFQAISEAPRDGRSLVLADETGWQAVGHGDAESDVWWLGHKDQPGVIEQLEFEPTRFAFPTSRREQ